MRSSDENATEAIRFHTGLIYRLKSATRNLFSCFSVFYCVLTGIYCLLLFRVALFILSVRFNGGCLGGDAKPTRAVAEFNHGQSFRKHI